MIPYIFSTYPLGSEMDSFVSTPNITLGDGFSEDDGHCSRVTNRISFTGQINLSDGKKVSVISATANTQEASK